MCKQYFNVVVGDANFNILYTVVVLTQCNICISILYILCVKMYSTKN